MMDAKIAFGIALKKVRKDKKVSQEQLALRADIDRAHISKLERGLFQPSLSTIIAIAEVLECRAGMLVDLAVEELANQEWFNTITHRFESETLFKFSKSSDLF